MAIRMNHRVPAKACAGLLVAPVAFVFGVGCTGEVYSEPAAPPGYVVASPAPTVVGPTVAPDGADADLVYTPDPPVPDIETYPSIIYEGVPVFFVDGEWYQRGPRGWGRYRHEPRELTLQREVHERDPRWTRARPPERREPERAVRPGVTERQPADRKPAAAPERREESQPPRPRRAPPVKGSAHPPPAPPPPPEAPREPQHR